MKQDVEPIREIGELSVIGLTLVIATLIGHYLGNRVDEYWPHLSPWGMVGGLGVGLAAGFTEMFRIIRRASSRLDAQHEKD